MMFLVAFLFGSIVGSFANVFVLRYGTGRSLGGRSSCGSCGTQLRWFELVPVVSWLVQRGRCRSCGSTISPQYLIVELIFGAVFALCAYSVSLTSGSSAILTFAHPYVLGDLIYLWVVSFLLISIAVYDTRHLIIPDGMVAALGAAVLTWNVAPLVASHAWLDAARVVGAGCVVAAPLVLLWLVSDGRWIGLGDAKLALAFGWMLGIAGGFSALVFGVWAGAAVSLAIIGITRLVSRRAGLTMKSEIPFGPFLVFGAFVVLITGATLASVISLF